MLLSSELLFFVRRPTTSTSATSTMMLPLSACDSSLLRAPRPLAAPGPDISISAGCSTSRKLLQETMWMRVQFFQDPASLSRPRRPNSCPISMPTAAWQSWRLKMPSAPNNPPTPTQGNHGYRPVFSGPYTAIVGPRVNCPLSGLIEFISEISSSWLNCVDRRGCPGEGLLDEYPLYVLTSGLLDRDELTLPSTSDPDARRIGVPGVPAVPLGVPLRTSGPFPRLLLDAPMSRAMVEPLRLALPYGIRRGFGLTSNMEPRRDVLGVLERDWYTPPVKPFSSARTPKRSPSSSSRWLSLVFSSWPSSSAAFASFSCGCGSAAAIHVVVGGRVSAWMHIQL